MEMEMKEEPMDHQGSSSHLPSSSGVDGVRNPDGDGYLIIDPSDDLKKEVKEEPFEDHSHAELPTSSTQQTSGTGYLRFHPGYIKEEDVCVKDEPIEEMDPLAVSTTTFTPKPESTWTEELAQQHEGHAHTEKGSMSPLPVTTAVLPQEPAADQDDIGSDTHKAGEHEELGPDLFYGSRVARVQRRATQQAVPIALEDAESETDPDGDEDDSDIDPDFQPGSPFDSHEDVVDERAFIEVQNSLDTNEENDTPVPRDESTAGGRSSSHTRESRAASRQTIPIWSPSDSHISTIRHEFLGPDLDFNDDLRHPVEYVREFLSQDILDIIVAQTNLYSVQQNPNKPINMTLLELEKWLGLCIYFSISKLPNIRMHWSTQLGPLREIASEVMSRNRWEEIKSRLHIVDNSALDPNPSNNKDKLFKVRPLVDHLRSKFQKIPMTQNLCIDEQMVPFKGTSSIKQYVAGKPHKWGYKFFVLADKFGMVYDFIPYTGKIEPVEDPNIPDLKPSSNIVLHLAQIIPSFNNHNLFFDNWFTSIPLLQHLASRGIWCCGTVRVPRLPGIKTKDGDKSLMKKGRGSYEEMMTSNTGHEVTYVKWFDSKVVNIVSTFAKANPLHTVTRYDSKAKHTIDIPCPDIIQLYNKCMGGVDLVDCLIELYRSPIRSKKYYHRLIFHMVDMLIVNSWMLYRRDANNLQLPKSEISPLATFKLRAAIALMKSGKPVSGLKRGRPASTEGPSEKRVKRSARPEAPVRLDNVGHLPKVEEPRRQCKKEGCSGKTNILCMKCNVNLCLNSRNNCFADFHTG